MSTVSIQTVNPKQVLPSSKIALDHAKRLLPSVMEYIETRPVPIHRDDLNQTVSDAFFGDSDVASEVIDVLMSLGLLKDDCGIVSSTRSEDQIVRGNDHLSSSF